MAQPATARVIAVGGGKGGVGKSFVTAGLATAISAQGKETTLIDLDLGAANLHTMFGIKSQDRGIGDFIYAPRSNNLADYAIDTGVEHLKLISGNGFIPGIANLTYAQKIRILRAIGRLNSDYVILDLGAGTSYNVVDFFSITASGIVVTMAEPTAILNAYEFLKNVLFRIFSQRFKQAPEIMDMINEFKIAPGEAPTIETLAKAVGAVDQVAEAGLREICREFRPGIVINMSRGEDLNLGQSLQDICRNFLSLQVDFLGVVPDDDSAQASFLKMRPVLLEFPDSKASVALRSIARKCLAGHWLDSRRLPHEPSAETQAGDAASLRASAPMRDLLEGRKETDLSSLLSEFLSSYSADARKDTIPAAQENNVLSPPSSGDLSPWDFHNFELRLDQQLTLPVFIPLPPQEKYPSRSFFGRLFREPDATRRVASIPDAENMALALDQALAEKTPPTRELGLAWLSTGMKLIDFNQLSGAIRALSRAHDGLPGDALAANNYAAALLSLGTAQPAIELLKAALRSEPGNPAMLHNLGLAQFALGLYPQAYDTFKRMVHQRDRTPFAPLLLAHCAYHLNHYTEARIGFLAIVSQDVRDAHARFNAGVCHLREKQYEEAVSLFTAFLFFSPEDAEALAARGLAQWYAGHKDDAQNDLTHAIKRQPSNLAFRGLRGTISFLSGRYDKAIEDIEIITRLLPENQKYQSLLVDIRNRAGFE